MNPKLDNLKVNTSNGNQNTSNSNLNTSKFDNENFENTPSERPGSLQMFNGYDLVSVTYSFDKNKINITNLEENPLKIQTILFCNEKLEYDRDMFVLKPYDLHEINIKLLSTNNISTHTPIQFKYIISILELDNKDEDISLISGVEKISSMNNTPNLILSNREKQLIQMGKSLGMLSIMDWCNFDDEKIISNIEKNLLMISENLNLQTQQSTNNQIYSKISQNYQASISLNGSIKIIKDMIKNTLKSIDTVKMLEE